MKVKKYLKCIWNKFPNFLIVCDMPVTEKDMMGQYVIFIEFWEVNETGQ